MRYVVFFILIIFSISANSEGLGGIKMHLYSRESGVDYNKIKLSRSIEEDKYLSEKKTLIVAVPRPDSPPMDITLRGGAYEGVTADVLGILSKVMGVEVVAKYYPSRIDAINAVKNGTADILGASNNYEISKELALTIPYIADEPAIYKRFGVPDNKIKTVAIPEFYLPFSEAIRYMPDVKIEVFTSRYSAVAAVAYGKVDAVLIDMLSGNFLINKYYQDEIQLVKPIYANTGGFAFAISDRNNLLRSILNDALVNIGEFYVPSVIKRWSGGGLSIQSKRPNLTKEEWQWIYDRKYINVAVGPVIPPLSFIDTKGNLHGVLADLFQVLSAKLGTEFIPVVLNSYQDEAVSKVRHGAVDAIVIPVTDKYKNELVFSRAFLIEPLVYVVNKESIGLDPSSLRKTGRSAIINGLMLYLDEKTFNKDDRNPVFFRKIEGALSCVADNTCDVTILPLRTAKYYINTNSVFRDNLYIAGELFDSIPVTANFAVSPDKKILADILDKVISSIPPDELENLANRARVSEKRSIVTWQEVIEEFGFTISIFVLVVFGAGIWTLLLLLQIKRRKRAESALESQLRFIEELVDSTPHPIYACDIRGYLVLCNDSYAAFLGQDKKYLLGFSHKNVESTWPFMAPLGDVVRQTLLDGVVFEGDCQLLLSDRVVDIYHWLQVYRDLAGNIQGVVGGWIDVSDRVALVRDLAEASQEAQEASRAKSTFLATMSHEIRTPMNAIIGLLELTLRKDILNAEVRESITVVYQSAHDLLGLIGDILDISKIESGKLELAPAPHRIVELSRAVINVFAATARQQGLTLNLTVGDDVTVMVDPIRYKQILSNLISNAIKFTREGGVNVSLSLQLDGEWCEVFLTVVDSGIGISKEDLGRLFQPFSQGSQPADLQKSGTGLGLMISRTLCQMMGGGLTLSSEPELGTTVSATLRLPLIESLSDIAVYSGEEPSAESHECSRKILVIDDHPTNRMLVSQQLTYLGHQVCDAISGHDAFQLLETQHFEVIITDFNMPDLDGLEFTARYRAQERREKHGRTVIIGLTADARQEQLQKAIEAGMDDCLFKPVSLDELKECLATHCVAQQYSSPAEIAAAIQRTLSRLTGGNAKLMRPLLLEFIQAADLDIQNLASADREGNSQDFLVHLHRLKGGAKIIGADELVVCCSEWEMSPRLPWCMPSALRQIEEKYRGVQEGVLYWMKEFCVEVE
ncbi:ATP-binding protein [Aeromonas hydrophila]|uniref:ATP-binding protein n=1 Tax=Aeromonas hydrophila TaxID=644 RepID=UPI003986B2DE